MKKFKLSKSQEKKLKKWQKKIKKANGEYGMYQFCFTPMGIGNAVTVYSLLTREELDLTEIHKW